MFRQEFLLRPGVLDYRVGYAPGAFNAGDAREAFRDACSPFAAPLLFLAAPGETLMKRLNARLNAVSDS